MQTVRAAPKPAGAPYRFTADEYFTMAAAGAIDPNVRTELVDGQVLLMAIPDWPHIQTKNLVHDELASGLAGARRGRWLVIDQDPLRLGRHDVRFPDIAVVPFGLGRVPEPGDVLLAIEISVTTLTADTQTKRRQYAGAGIPHYWVVDVRARQVRVYGQPRDGDYRTATTLGVGDQLALTVEQARPVAVAALFPA
ncbi:MAG TPA: Uma2 family endonuclease [Chloroflexota bacterium]|jgi:Uma2 family endonuclease